MENLFQQLRAKLEGQITLLKDKPEETLDTSLRALWHKAYGSAKSAEQAATLPLPPLSEAQIATLNQLIEERLNGKPLAYITGRQSFMGIEFLCDPRALIPRKETEILGRAAVALCQNLSREKRKINILDVGCGCGNLGLALASFVSNAAVHASDLSQEAVDLTRENVGFLKLMARVTAGQSDLFSRFESPAYWGSIDLIVCNPPYISTPKVAKMDREISAHEPAMAFDGGAIGLAFVQRLIRESPKFLAKDGWLAFEVGVGQGPFMVQSCERSELYKQIEPMTDDAGNIRVIAVCRKDS